MGPLTFNLGTSVAIVDAPANRVALLTAGTDQSLTTTFVPVGANVLNAATSADGTKLFVASAGHRARLGDGQPTEAPSITVVSATGAPQRYDLMNLTDPLAGMAVDPAGNWLVLYPSADSSQPAVQNPNELLVINLMQAAGPVMAAPRTLMSFGGHPQRFTFTPLLQLPGGAQQSLLIVESDEDLSLLRLDSDLPEITVPLTNGSDTNLLSPAGIAVYPGDLTHGACVGVRLANDHDVVTLQFVPNVDAGGKPIGNGFLPTVNLNDVGGVASDIAFVNTDSGLRLAALVPPLKKATLIDPTTSLRTDVALPAPYQNLSVVTNAVGTAGSCDDAATAPRVATDVALLWNGSSVQGQEGVAFWELGQTGCQSYRSIDTVGVTDVVAGVLDVPAPNDRLKVLQTRDASAFYILNLANRTAAPLRTSTSNIALSISPRGDQVWTYVPNGTTVSTTDLSHQLLPRSLLIERPVSGVYEVTRGTDNPAVVVLHDQGGIGATVYDAKTLDDSTRRLYGGLLLGGSR
jgi:DNA-binding beta-propeller fold protein YncE